MNKIELFLSSLLYIYAAAFSSILIQSKGLYSPNGVLPINLIRQQEKNDIILRNKLFTDDIFTNFCAFNLIGVILSSIALIFSIKTKIIFALLWISYFALYQVGQTFLWFQWDILLLEVGFIAIFIPRYFFYPTKPKKSTTEWCGSSLAFWLVKWLIFRLMFASGVVKLQSHCPTWWGLTALNWHYESQCIPTHVSWVAHKFPDWLQSLSVVATYMIEIIVPIFFFVPISGVQWFCFGCQLLLQCMIILTGNYNFFNILTVSLCFAILPRQNSKKTKKYSWKKVQRLIEDIITAAIIGWIFYQTVYYFNVKYDSKKQIVRSNIIFTKDFFEKKIRFILPVTVYVGVLSLAIEILRLLVILPSKRGILKKTKHLFDLILTAGIVCFVFTISLVPYVSSLDRGVAQNIPPKIFKLYEKADRYQLVNSYGLFRSMTGVGGRPEIVIEGANEIPEDDDNVWKEFEFKYKPGSLSRMLPFIIPHQPRLDWQMWFAALGSYQHNPWLINLIVRILQNEPDVLALLEDNPFRRTNKAPRYVRVMYYNYHYTSFSQYNKTGNWWKRDSKEEYLFPVSLRTIQDYIQQNNLERGRSKMDKSEVVSQPIKFINWIMTLVNQNEGHMFVWKVLGLIGVMQGIVMKLKSSSYHESKSKAV